jgi:hypothetical protein
MIRRNAKSLDEALADATCAFIFRTGISSEQIRKMRLPEYFCHINWLLKIQEAENESSKSLGNQGKVKGKR